MSALERFRDYCRVMAATEAHLPDCESLRPAERARPIWHVVSGEDGIPSQMVWGGVVPAYTPPTCDGCVPENDRALFARMAAEIDEYLTTDDAPLWEDA